MDKIYEHHWTYNIHQLFIVFIFSFEKWPFSRTGPTCCENSMSNGVTATQQWGATHLSARNGFSVWNGLRRRNSKYWRSYGRSDFGRGHSMGPMLGDQTMQMQGDFDGFPTYMGIVWVGNIMMHVWMREVVRKIAWQWGAPLVHPDFAWSNLGWGLFTNRRNKAISEIS